MTEIKKNWITTCIGLLIILGTLGNIALCSFIQGGDISQCITENWAQFSVAVGLIMAKDAITLTNPEKGKI